MHSSESPNQMLSDVPLTRGNYRTWSREVRRSIGLKNKLCFILDNSDITKTKLGDKLFDSWKQANDIVITWLVRSMNSNIYKVEYLVDELN